MKPRFRFLPAGLLFSQQLVFEVPTIKPTTHARDANGFSQNDDRPAAQRRK